MYKELCENNTKYAYFGIRIDDKVYSVGDDVDCSRVWDNNEPTEDLLDGTSCIWLYDGDKEKYNAKAESIIKNYIGKHMYIIASNRRQYGMDESEWVLVDATIVKVVR
jgi:hypothetical protein